MSNYLNIPAELRERQQWVNWRLEHVEGAAKPTKPLYDPRSGWHAKSTDPATWVDFETAVKAAETGIYSGIGYVVSKNDPYTFIDLDTYDPKLTEADKERHTKIFAAFAGYAELSPSGKGLHLIVKGKVPEGRKRGGIEIYSDGRYMTVTGNVYRNEPIVDQQELLRTLWEEMSPQRIIDTITDGPQTEDDVALCNKAYHAENGQLFTTLYKGEWQQLYSSQSEADQALINIIAFYTKNRDQVRRIFRASALGQRDKAQRDGYVNYSLNKAWDNKPPEINFDALRANIENQMREPEPEIKLEVSNDIYAVPPNGLLGDIAKYIYSAAPRPVAEIALCGAIGLLAGICGRSYNVGGSGLNHYLLLLAPTGSGKEAIASGISKIMEQVKKTVPAAMDFIGPGEIRSDAALLKHLAKRSSSFLTVGGEFGHTLEQMSAINGSHHIKSIKKVMLDLYGKSGKGDVLGSTAYSNEANTTLALNSPAFTFIGESAPERFFNSVDEALVADGLLPRFTMIEYKGEQRPLNKFRNHPPSEKLINEVAALCAQSLNLNNAGKVIDIEIEKDAEQLLEAFEESCRLKVNAGDEVTRQLWNRTHIRALKLAGLYAIGENPFQPILKLNAVQWAVALSTHNTKQLLSRFERGEVGVQTGDDKQVKELCHVIAMYLNSKPDESKSEIYKKMFNDRVVGYSTIQNKAACRAAFKNARIGSTNAIRTAIKNLIASGELIEIAKPQMKMQYGTTQEAYIIVNPQVMRRV